MAGFADVLGNEHIKNHFIKGIQADRISHAYIINGDKGMGKKTVAKAFAMTLLCQEKGSEPCMKCKSCIQAMSDNNPDIIYIEPDKPNLMSIELVREKLVNDVSLRPYSYSHKVYIVSEADLMNQQAQNAILKTIEEPPEYAVILLLTGNEQRMLPTVKSRCIKLDMRPLRKEVIKEYLMKIERIVDYQAEVAAGFAAGNLGRAKELATSEEFGGMITEVINLLKHIKDMPSYEVVAAVKHMEEYKFSYEEFIDILILWFRDLLVFKASQDPNQLMFKDEYSTIRKYAESTTYSGVEEILNALYKAKIRLRANVNFDVTIELLYLTIRDNI